MFPFLESKRRSVTMLDASLPAQEANPIGRDDSRESDMKHMALRALAGHMMSAIKSGSVEDLTDSLHTLCDILSYGETPPGD